jgi:hypothetical protein
MHRQLSASGIYERIRLGEYHGNGPFANGYWSYRCGDAVIYINSPNLNLRCRRDWHWSL